MSGHSLAPMVDTLAHLTPLDADQRAALLAIETEVRSLPAFSHIAHFGRASDHCHVLTAGYACSYRILPDGGRQIVAFHQRGDLLDIQLGSPLSLCEIQPIGAASVAVVSRRDLARAALQHSQIAVAFAAHAHVALSIMMEWLVNLGRRNAQTRLAHLICELAARQRAAGLSVDNEIAWPFPQSCLGDAAGLTTIHVNRTLQRLRADQLISISGRRLTILDWQRLCTTGQFSPLYLGLPAQTNAESRMSLGAGSGNIAMESQNSAGARVSENSAALGFARHSG